MPTYVVLIDWTDQGLRESDGTLPRYETTRAQFKDMGVDFRETWWTLGNHDLVSVVDAPDDEVLAAALLALGQQGRVRTTTLRAFTTEQMRGIVGRAA
jgi:uncharacterized protein with GYD domain